MKIQIYQSHPIFLSRAQKYTLSENTILTFLRLLERKHYKFQQKAPEKYNVNRARRGPKSKEVTRDTNTRQQLLDKSFGI